jgi:secretion/DNA translocation related CpaE-like protein
MVLVGVDKAAELATQILPRRSDTFVVGMDADRDQTIRWSVPLAAAVVLLPSSASWLSTALVDVTGLGIGSGFVLAICGGSGGVGTSTCAAALAFAGARRGLKALLVDADCRGGGIDLLVGAERISGWRWPRLANARGHLGDLSGHLPWIDGVDVLSTARGHESAASIPDLDQMKAVLLSATRSHDLVVVDLPRELTLAGREVLRRSDLVLLLVRGQLRGLAAAQQTVSQLGDTGTKLELLVRTARPSSLSGKEVAGSLGLPLRGTVVDDTTVRAGGERGEPPGRSARSQLARTCSAVLNSLDWRKSAA